MLAIGESSPVRPESFDEYICGDWDLWVLKHGLPEGVPEPVLGESVPVARWSGPSFGAVLQIAWQYGVPDEEDSLVSEVRVYRRHGSSWEASDGGGGTSWFNPPFVRPSGLGPRDVWGFHIHESGGDQWRCRSADGFAGADAVRVELHDSAGVTSRAIESPFGAFIVAWDATEAVRLRVFDAQDVCMLDQEAHTCRSERSDVVQTGGVGWLRRMDERNQRRAERDNRRLIEESDDEDAGPVEIATSYLSLWGGLVGILAAVVALVAGLVRLRRRP